MGLDIGRRCVHSYASLGVLIYTLEKRVCGLQQGLRYRGTRMLTYCNNCKLNLVVEPVTMQPY
jgi:hypothetical protein